MDILFPEYRLDWFGAGPSSPNKTGALLAIVFVVAWWPALQFRRGFWLSLPVAFVAAGLLLQTESRGALVAANVGLSLLIGGSIFNRLNALNGRLKLGASFFVRAASCAALLIALLFYSQQLGVNNRMATMTTGEDESANVRVALYAAGFQMIAAAPLGWGGGQAGDAYGQWYQEVGDSRSYLSLVNSHLTWMAQGGMLFQFLYIAAWCLVLVLCWPVPWTPLRAIAFGSWITLGLCGFFSSVLTLGWLWLIPGALLLLCIAQRVRSKLWPTKRQRLITSTVVLAGFVGLQATGRAFTGDIPIQAAPSYVKIGETPEAVALIEPNTQILGDKYGHTVREYLKEIGGLTVVRSTSSGVDWSEYDTLAASGNAQFPNLRSFSGNVVWLNPPADVSEAALDELKSKPLTVIVGSLGDWRRLRAWQNLADEHPNWNLISLRGVADFIPNWPKYLMPEGDN